MALKLGDSFPDFTAHTDQGELRSFHDWIGSSWAILFSHPADFTPVCTTELARAAQLHEEFEKRNVKLIALSCDSVKSHKGWIADILSYGSQYLNADSHDGNFPFPIISDESRELANRLGMIDPDEIDSVGQPLTARAVFVIDPTKRLKLSILYPATTGRNFDEILRVVDSLQLTAQKKVATPVDWKQGQQCAIIPSVNASDVDGLFGEENVNQVTLPSGKGYLRLVKLVEKNEKNGNATTTATMEVVDVPEKANGAAASEVVAETDCAAGGDTLSTAKSTENSSSQTIVESVAALTADSVEEADERYL